jgi:NAD(P)-dependent dehydrogenase (short-subunit alcohol dehydrogenase family)
MAPSKITDTVLPAVRMLLSEKEPVVLCYSNTKAHAELSGNTQLLKRLKEANDAKQYCIHAVLTSCTDESSTISNISSQISDYRKAYKRKPNIVIMKNNGIIASGCCEYSAKQKLKNLGKILKGIETNKKVSLKNDDKNCCRELSTCDKPFIKNKIVIVTGGAQGFGEGIVRTFASQGANVVIADLNDALGKKLAAELSAQCKTNSVSFVKTNVSDDTSIAALLSKTVHLYGGLDVFVSNAGVLRAGGISELSTDAFDFMTNINYKGYFLCVRHAGALFKLQHSYKDDFFSDIIQINSKSGLQGSNKNFAYAGGKFGGIGLTQSFALELMPHNTKVNSICPGNFFDGPLWSDPKKGLFVQYLKAGKVKGAKNIADVKKHYENQVPAGRGAAVSDVMKAVFYVIEQKYETGQAVPVTGGQVMLH